MSIAVFAISAVIVAFSGVRMTRVADELADRTGLGEAITGGLLLGVSTSLSGTVTSITAAAEGLASLAASNAIGGIAVQTAFLFIADVAYRRANLEHAGADVRHLLQAALLILLLCLPVIAWLLPEFSILAIHPVSIALFGIYLLGVSAAMRIPDGPTWQPEYSRDFRHDRPDADAQVNASMRRLVSEFGVLALILTIAGFAIAESGSRIAELSGLSETVVGTVLTSTATSLPELVVTLAAVRRGALQLAIGGIVGGNTYDILFLTLSDIFYREGSLYHALVPRDILVLVAAIVITAILLIGLILRDRRSIGFEGVSIVAVYIALVITQLWLG